MKIKVVANYDTDYNMYKSVLNCFGEDNSLKLVYNEKPDYLIIINGYDVSKINVPRERVIGLLQEPIGNVNYDRNLHFYCDKIICQSSKMFNSYKGIVESPLCMFYSNHVIISKQVFDIIPVKNKKMSLIMSGITEPNDIKWENHNYAIRHNILKMVLESDFDIDIYGRDLLINDKRYKGTIENKHDALKDYEFSIAIENCCETNYISEKFFDCLLNNTVPIYYGADNVSNIYPTDSFIIIKDYKKIIDILHHVKNNEKYDLRISATQEAKKIYFNKFNIYNKLRDVL